VAETGNKALIWEGHKAGRDIGYCHLENCTTSKPCRPWLHHQLLPAQDPWRQRRLDAGGGDLRRTLNACFTSSD
jgi:hypothetical protein